MIGSFTFENLPCRVVFGSGTLASAKAEIERLGGKRALVLTTPQQEAQGGSSVSAWPTLCRHLRRRHHAHAH